MKRHNMTLQFGMLALAVAMLVGPAGATTITDDFQRANANTLGANWTTFSDLYFGIRDNMATNLSQVISPQAAMANGLTVTDATFTASADVQVTVQDVRRIGLALNIQPGGQDFYEVRWQASSGQIQVIRVTGGAHASVIGAETTGITATEQDIATLSVDSTSAGVFEVTIAQGVDSYTFTATDASPLTGGGLGLAFSDTGLGAGGTGVVSDVSELADPANSGAGWVRYHNFQATTVPEPGSMGLLALAGLGILRRRKR